MNKKGQKPGKTRGNFGGNITTRVVQDFENVVGQESVTRFDERKRKNHASKIKKKNRKIIPDTNGQPASEHKIAKPIKKNEQNKENNQQQVNLFCFVHHLFDSFLQPK
jgi:hypothetical protein